MAWFGRSRPDRVDSRSGCRAHAVPQRRAATFSLRPRRVRPHLAVHALPAQPVLCRSGEPSHLHSQPPSAGAPQGHRGRGASAPAKGSSARRTRSSNRCIWRGLSSRPRRTRATSAPSSSVDGPPKLRLHGWGCHILPPKLTGSIVHQEQGFQHCCHHEEGFSPTRDLLFVQAARIGGSFADNFHANKYCYVCIKNLLTLVKNSATVAQAYKKPNSGMPVVLKALTAVRLAQEVKVISDQAGSFCEAFADGQRRISRSKDAFPQGPDSN